MEYPSETHVKSKPREVSFVYNLFRSCLIGVKFRRGHGSDSVVLCAKFQNDRTTETGVINEDYFRTDILYCTTTTKQQQQQQQQQHLTPTPHPHPHPTHPNLARIVRKIIFIDRILPSQS